jgi:hypothetical protein
MSLPNDAYGRLVSFLTDGTTDTYIAKTSPSMGGSSYNFPAGTAQGTAYLTMAQKENLRQFSNAATTFLNLAYSQDKRIEILMLMIQAQRAGLTARATYLAQYFTFHKAFLVYEATYAASVNAITIAANVPTTTWNFTTGVGADPGVTVAGALAITT